MIIVHVTLKCRLCHNLDFMVINQASTSISKKISVRVGFRD